MDDLLREFLTETSESLDTVDNQLVRFEQDPSDAKILDNIFRLVHTIKGTCGFLGLPRLEALAHAGETLMGKFRDGMPVKAEAVTLILSSIDRIKEILAGLEATETEPEGTDEDLIEKLHAMAEGGHHAEAEPAPAPVPVVAAPPGAARDRLPGTLVDQVLERPLASRRSLARRPRARLPRDRDRNSSRAEARPRRQARRRAGRAGSQGSCQGNRQGSCKGKTCQARRGRRHRRPGSRQDRQPVDPRQRRHARTSDDHGLRAGA